MIHYCWCKYIFLHSRPLSTTTAESDVTNELAKNVSAAWRDYNKISEKIPFTVIWSSHSGDYEEHDLLGCNGV
jgi:hypothetical protein